MPAKLIVPPGVERQQQRTADLREMTTSQRVAAAVALRKLGYHVVAEPDGVLVDAVELGSHAAGKLQPTDVIVSVNGAPTLTIAQLRTELGQGQARRRRHAAASAAAASSCTVKIPTIADPLDPHRALVGFTPDQSANIKLPIKVADRRRQRRRALGRASRSRSR